ncbi:hypothetical protein, partial [Ligilactobacillus ruminis]|uniref:hypothetical protein n=1 Tax=Ligilactobacillus ruminis TaxID=1623 RepID=UPI0019D39C04
ALGSLFFINLHHYTGITKVIPRLRANGRFLRFARKIQRFCQIHAAALPNMILIFRPTKNTCEQHAHEIK